MSDAPIYVRRGEAFGVGVSVYVGQAIDATTTGGSDFVADLRTQSGAVVRTVEAEPSATGLDVLDSNGTGAWPIGDLYLHARWVDSTGEPRAMSPPLRVVVVESDETHVVAMKTSAFGALGAYQTGPVYAVARMSRSVDGAGGGGVGPAGPPGPSGPAGPVGPPGPAGEALINVDGGTPSSGPAVVAIDGGAP